MRVTNRMMTNGLLNNINSNKNRISSLADQYSTGLKIQRPSEDPIVAVRALKLRSDLSELNQYYEKNIPDALAWMDVTEGALKLTNSIITKMNSYCVQGSTDTLTPADRSNVLANLEELKDQIYQEGNSDYAGRYVFTGYKTDSSLVFPADTEEYNYQITEKLHTENIIATKKVIGAVDVSEYNTADPASSVFTAKPDFTSAYRLRLSYTNLTNTAPSLTIGGTAVDASKVITVNSNDPIAYTPADGTINYIPETGELVFANDLYKNMTATAAGTDIGITYEKTNFKKNDLKPEHYFDCQRTNVDPDDGSLLTQTQIDFTKTDQEIKYEINFNQMITVNTLGSDAITHTVGRCIDDLKTAYNEITAVEASLAETEKKLAQSNITDDEREALTELKELLNTEHTLREEALQTTFEKTITELKNQQNIVGNAISDLGSRYVRVQLTDSRLSTQQVDFKDLLSTNEDADIAETVVNYSSMEVIYNASLSAASKVVQRTLLDFL